MPVVNFFMSKLDDLLSQASKHSRHWITDAVADKRSGAGDNLSEAADDFVVENGRWSKYLVNEILDELGEDPIFVE